MLIVSKYHDYYDTVQIYGQDKSIVYNRNIECMELDGKVRSCTIKNNKTPASKINYNDPAPSLLKNEHEIYSKLRLVRNIHNIISYVSGFILFCGKVIPILIEWKPSNICNISLVSTVSHYSIDSLPELEPRMVKRVKRFFEEITINDNEVLDVHRYFDSPVVLLTPYMAVTNPILKNLNFQKNLDPFTTHQEISMYVGGVLGNIEKELTGIKDKDRIIGKGFDIKQSFRKRKNHEN